MSEIQGDSISRCNQESCYQNRAPFQSQAGEKVARTTVYGDDKLESVEEKMERQALEKVYGGNAHLMNRTFMVLGQVGKFTFLVVMLPGYLFLYQVPKWLLLEAFPQLFHSTIKIIQSLNEVVKRVLNIFINKTSSLAKFTKVLKLENIAQFLQPLNAKTKQLFGAVLRGISRLTTSLSEFTQKHVAKNLARAQLLIAKVNHLMQPPLSKAKDKISKILKNLSEVSLPLFALNASKATLVAVKETGNSIMDLAKLAKSGAKLLASKIKDAPKNAVKLASNAIQALNQYAVQPAINLMMDSAKFLINSASKGAVWTLTKSLAHAAKIREKIAASIKELPKKLAALLEESKVLILNILNPIVQGIFPPLQNLAKKIAEFSKRNAKKGGSLLKAAVANSVVYVKEKVQDLWALLLKKLRLLLNAFFRKLKEVPQKMKKLCIFALQIARKGIVQAYSSLRDLLKWIALLHRHSMQRVRQIAFNLEKRFLR